MQNNFGNLILIPTTLGPNEPLEVLPISVKKNVENLNFFIVENEDKTTVYTVYFKFVREVLNKQTSQSEDATEILRDNPDLDYL